MNKKIIVGLVVVVVLAAGVWAYFAMQQNASAPQSSKNSNTSATMNKNDTNVAGEITYTDSGFSPEMLTVKKGSMIKINNQSSGPLQFSSDDHPTHTKDTELNMSSMAAGEEMTLEVTKVGTWGYHNHLKSQDKGSLTVTD